MSLLAFYSNDGVLQKLPLQFSNTKEISSLLVQLGVPSCISHYYVINGCLLQDQDSVIPSGSHVHAVPRMVGGKGGFGSMLRAIGAQIEKTTSREACRDLSGRRMRDVNNEKKLKEWIGQEADRERERAQRRHERMERRRSQPKHNFEDETYHEHRVKIADNLEDALQEGLIKKKSSKASATVTQSTLSRKRASEEAIPGSSKKKCEWIGLDLDSASDIDTDEDSSSDADSGARASLILSGDSESTSSSLFECNTLTSVTTTSCVSTDNENWSKEQNCLPQTSNECCQPTEMIINNDVSNNCENSSEHTIIKNKSLPSQDDDATGISSLTEKHEVKSKDLFSNKAEVKKLNSLQDNIEDEFENAKSSAEKNHFESHDLLDMLSKVPPNKNFEVNQSEKLNKPVNLEDYESAAEVEELGLDVLKSELMSRGLKCGGTLQQRAERLFSVKGLSQEQINPSLFAKSTNGKGGKKK